MIIMYVHLCWIMSRNHTYTTLLFSYVDDYDDGFHCVAGLKFFHRDSLSQLSGGNENGIKDYYYYVHLIVK